MPRLWGLADRQPGGVVLVCVPPEAALMSGFECGLLILEVREMPAAGSWGSETGRPAREGVWCCRGQGGGTPGSRVGH